MDVSARQSALFHAARHRATFLCVCACLLVVAGCGKTAAPKPSAPVANSDVPQESSAKEPAAERPAPPPTTPPDDADNRLASPFPPLAALPDVPVPGDNPITEAKVALGKLLFFDNRLSGDLGTKPAAATT